MNTEKQIEALFSAIDKNNIKVNCIVEAGARDATDTVKFSDRFPNSQITIFECNPANIPLCRRAIQGRNIRLIERALSDKDGSIDFHIVKEEGGSSSVFVHNELGGEKITVPVTTLQKELRVFPNLMWLDAQGSELSIFKGCGERIKEIDIIHTEIYFKPAYLNQPLYRDVKDYLYKNGFRLLKFSSVPYNFGDAIFINKKIKKIFVPSFLIEFNEFIIKKILIKLKIIK